MSGERFRDKARAGLDPARAAALVEHPDQAPTGIPPALARQAVGGLDAPTCRGHALECAVMALAAGTAREKQLFTRLFQAWTNLAIDLERREQPS